MNAMKKSMMLFWIASANMTAVFAVTGYLLADNEPPYEWKSGVVIPDPAPDGSQVSVCWSMRIRRFCPGTIQRQIVDAREEVHNYDPVPAADRVDVADPFCVTFKLPLGMPEGATRYRVHASYYCNPLQYVFPLRVSTPEIPFTVYQASK